MEDLKDKKYKDTDEAKDTLNDINFSDGLVEGGIEETDECPTFKRVHGVDVSSSVEETDIEANSDVDEDVNDDITIIPSKPLKNAFSNEESSNNSEEEVEYSVGDTDLSDESNCSEFGKGLNIKDRLNLSKVFKDKSKSKIVIGVVSALVVSSIGLNMAINSAIVKSTPLEASMSYIEFMEQVDSKKVESVTLQARSFLADVELKDGKKETIINPNTDTFIEDLGKKGVEVKVQMTDFSTELSTIITSLLSLGFSGLLTGLMIFYFVKMLSMFKGKVSGDTANGKRVEVTDENRVTFDDVAGLTEEKEELQYAILSLKDAEKMKARGSKPIKGVLLEGGPGVGKTLLAKAVAGEANVPFFSYSGSDFTEMFVGMGAMRVRKMFDDAIANAPCVIFIDEIDALGGKRSSGSFGGNSERDNTLIAMLEKMDGMNSLNNVLVIGATNRVDALDDALIRPGRFDKVIHISKPRSKEDREAIVKVHLRNKTVEEGITVEQISKEFYGFSGAEIESALNDAVLESFKDGKDGVINLEHINKAVMKLIIKGVAKGRHNEEDRERVAIHEAGHAIMYKHLGKKLIKVSIQPYSGGVGGFTQADSEANEINFMTEKDFRDQVKVLYGGMVAEEVLLGSASTGASNDLERATVLLDKMLSTYGLVDGSLIVKSALNNNVIGNSVSDDYIKELDSIANSIKEEVVELFNTVEVRNELIDLTEELLDKEVVYYN